MKKSLVAFMTLLGLAAFVPEANAVVFARGVHRGGFAGPRAVVRPAVPYGRGVVVAPVVVPPVVPYYRPGVVVRPRRIID